jgi:hypothetical protein
VLLDVCCLTSQRPDGAAKSEVIASTKADWVYNATPADAEEEQPKEDPAGTQDDVQETKRLQPRKVGNGRSIRFGRALCRLFRVPLGGTPLFSASYCHD